jgi:hypothetical protein
LTHSDPTSLQQSRVTAASIPVSWAMIKAATPAGATPATVGKGRHHGLV